MTKQALKRFRGYVGTSRGRSSNCNGIASNCNGIPSHFLGRYTGWRPDSLDQRDFPYEFRLGFGNLPLSVDLRPTCPPVYDQGELGSCTANAIAAAYQFCQDRQNAVRLSAVRSPRPFTSWIPSRLFIYWNERALEGTIDQDSGAQLRDGIKTVVKQGVCSENIWPYDIRKFTKRPIAACYTAALLDQVTKYQRLQSIYDMKDCLATGFPFVFGFSIYESFQSPAVASTGIVPMPGLAEDCLGGHAVMAVGYDDRTSRFIVRNSWGSKWGQSGYFTMPYDYLQSRNLSDDFWTIRMVE